MYRRHQTACGLYYINLLYGVGNNITHARACSGLPLAEGIGNVAEYTVMHYYLKTLHMHSSTAVLWSALLFYRLNHENPFFGESKEKDNN